MKDLLVSIGCGFTIAISGIGGLLFSHYIYYCYTEKLLPFWISFIAGMVCAYFANWTMNQLENNNNNNNNYDN